MTTGDDGVQEIMREVSRLKGPDRTSTVCKINYLFQGGGQVSGALQDGLEVANADPPLVDDPRILVVVPMVLSQFHPYHTNGPILLKPAYPKVWRGFHALKPWFEQVAMLESYGQSRRIYYAYLGTHSITRKLWQDAKTVQSLQHGCCDVLWLVFSQPYEVQ